jgi:Ca2+-transporting ATPase
LDELSEIHDPKSIKFFQDRFDNRAQSFYDTLKTDPINGLDPELPDLDSRTAQFGVNKLPEKKPKTFLQLVWHEMHDKVLILLSVAAVISLALGLYEYFGQPPQRDAEGNEIPKVEWVDGVAIIVAVFIVVSVGAANNYQKELQFAKLNAKKSDREIVVIRGSDEHVISIYELLVGDIITLQTGDVLPADCVLVSGSCECDESALTGESHSVHKIDIESALKKYNSDFPRSDADIGTKGVPDPFLISGSRLLSGLGRAIVTAVGPNSIHGRTLESLKVETEDTPLQVRLNGLADGITKYGILASVILFIILFGKFLANLRPGKSYHDLKPAEKGSRFLDIVITAITLIVVAVPEGLPLAVTLALAFATTRMAKDQNLVRVLKACEIMGGATAVCSDKTGTLTENIMRVVNGNISSLEFDDNTTSTTTKSNELPLSGDVKLNILTNIALNSTAFENKQTVVNENPMVHKRRWFSRESKITNFGNPDPEPFIGSKTETALLMLAEKSLEMTGSNSLHKLRTNLSLLGVESIVQVIPFESSRKWGGIVVKYPNSSKYTFFIKGAAELLSSRCSHRVTSDSSVIPIDAEASEWVSQKINSYGEMALRAITFAHRDFELSSWPPHEYIGKAPDAADPELLFGNASGNSNDDDGLILDGIVGIKDPLRPGVKEAVAQCKRAGVTVRMVTGDNIVTARAIALNCGILQEEDLQNSNCCMEGPIFRKLTKSQKSQVLPELKVLARSSPEDKRVLVELLKKQGEVVAVTGDGTNDAPALKLADVGFSMGIAGTEVAREASDIILMTDDFAAIVNAIKWGRCVSSSIKKFIQFQLTVNITAVTLTFVSAVASSDGHSVLTAVQLLWVNLIMDTLAALALATDKPDDTVLDHKPDGRKAPLISVSMWKMILGQSSLQLVVTFVLHFAGAQIFFGSSEITNHEQTQLDALTFNTFVWLQFFKLWVTRKLDEADGIKTIKGRCTAFNLNFFQHLFRNYYFLAIALLIGGCQVLIMFIGGTAFSVTRQTGAQWATAIICGMLSLPWGVVIRIIPDEWAVAIFPERLFKFTMAILSLQFLRPKKERIVLNSDDESEPMWSEVPQFKRTREDIIYVREFDSDSSFNPISLYHRWRGDSFSQDEESTIRENTHALSALTMVPTVVGGAIAGWSPLTQPNTGDKKID